MLAFSNNNKARTAQQHLNTTKIVVKINEHNQDGCMKSLYFKKLDEIIDFYLKKQLHCNQVEFLFILAQH